MDHDYIAMVANRVSAHSGKSGAPTLRASSELRTLCRWIRWFDPDAPMRGENSIRPINEREAFVIVHMYTFAYPAWFNEDEASDRIVDACVALRFDHGAMSFYALPDGRVMATVIPCNKVFVFADSGPIQVSDLNQP